MHDIFLPRRFARAGARRDKRDTTDRIPAQPQNIE
jgi:hypothetical protein